MDTIEYVNAVKTRLHITSDYAVAKALGVSKQAVSRYMKGVGYFDDYVAIRVAQTLNVDPLRVIADVNMQRADNPEVKAVWSSFLDKLSASFNDLLLGRGPHVASL